MTTKIRVLPDHTINKIAAGEVIENPASVVKELVENSIDAGSTEICVEIKGGGRLLIRVTDNGSGMSADDALLCLERHATSKLREVEDIHTLSTMGFRGEAIPSIASISKFNLLTRPEEASDDAAGTMVIVDGGDIISCKPAVRSKGTTIEVKALFFNVPVRKKFLKSPAVDANEILKMTTLIALGHPEIRFQLISEGKTILDTSPAGIESPFDDRLKARVEDTLGKEFSENLSFIDSTNDKISLQGGVGLPSYTRHNRSAQYLFINKRAVVSPLVSYAVKEGFGTSIPSGRFPSFVLHLTLPGNWVDVNVHPQKREVRLRQEQIVKELVINAVRGTLTLPNSFQEASAPYSWFAPAGSAWTSPRPTEPDNVPEQWSLPPKSPVQPFSTYTAAAPAIKPEASFHVKPDILFEERAETPPKVAATLPGYFLIEASQDHPIFSKGCRSPEKQGLVIVDQKRAHARIIFERLSMSESQQKIAQQTLLIPHTIELAAHEADALRRSLPHLNSMGLSIKEFSSNTFVIDALPQVFGNNAIDQLIFDLLQDVRTWQDPSDADESAENTRAKQIAQTASRTAVSNGKKLGLQEAQHLLGQLLKCRTPTLCPSGKPVFVQVSLDDLAKLFQR